MKLTKKEVQNQLLDNFNKAEIDVNGIVINKFKIIDDNCYIGKITITLGDLDFTCWEIKDVVNQYCDKNDINCDGVMIDC